jgi:membrane protease YdiL (CAAX protease family)
VHDVRDIFEALARIAQYADERLRAAALGQELPEPPRLFADIVSLRLLLALTIVSQVATVGAVLLITSQTPRGLVRALGMDHYRASWLLRPFLMTIAAYAGVAAYATITTIIGWDPLIPESTLPTAVANDGLALALAGVAAVIGAPLSEEVLHRGLVFGGLLRWGFWPASMISAGIFAAIHLDTGSLIPFFGIGMALAWLFSRRRTLWDAVAFHLFFNLTSYLILVFSGVAS